MARSDREHREENHLVRGYALGVLDAAASRERGDEESPSTYVDEELLFVKVGRRYPQTKETLRKHLYYLYEKGYAKFKQVKVGSKLSLMWRITAAGTDLLDWTKEDPGVYVG